MVTPSEAKKIAEYDAALSQTKAKKKYLAKSREARVHTYFKPTPAIKYKAADKKGASVVASES